MGEIEQLVRRAKKRDPDAFTELMQLHETGYVPYGQCDPVAGCGYCGRHAGDDSHRVGRK